MTSMELAGALDISEASVVRFSKALGYSGYVEFQRELRKDFQEKVQEVAENITVPSEKLIRSSMTDHSMDSWALGYQEVLENIHNTVVANSIDRINKAADIIVNSKHKFIAATRGNAALGDYFLLYMKHMLPDVETTTSASISSIDHMCSITEEDCLILFSFPRYSSIDKITAQMARDAKAKVVVITDRPSSDLAKYATVYLTAPVDITAFYNSMVAPQFLTEALLHAISQKVTGL
ncbi:MAG: MurR/RpiR family transcriptional regulator [Lachnospiraceae bacterium]|nr:MurR/RpiR family transcriptional regulator [Lachnospiraceae bacterium]